VLLALLDADLIWKTNLYCLCMPTTVASELDMFHWKQYFLENSRATLKLL
jgi:hypothetical protein